METGGPKFEYEQQQQSSKSFSNLVALATKTNFVTKMLHLAMKKTNLGHQNCHLATKNSVVKVCHTLCVKLWATNFDVLETNLIGRERLSLL